MAWDLQEAVAYYKGQGAPADQGALIALLKEVQRENGGRIPARFLRPLCDSLNIKESYVQAVIKRIPSLHLGEGHTLELCAGPNCGKRAALAAFAEKSHIAAPKKFSLQYVGCMRLCGKGPNIKWDGKLYHQADEELLRRLIETAE